MNQLFKRPKEEGQGWLPCYKVFGEGIFLELNEEKLTHWEKQNNVLTRANRLINNINIFRRDRDMPEIGLSEYPPRYFLLHTLSHIFLNQLTFDCGYSTASLKERIFSSTNENIKMAGILIYTAAGDSEGTMGGLVKIGSPEFFEDIFYNAITNSKWCSSDPICMEIGNTGGQGPNSLNLAACHNCCLVPEGACEDFNCHLDRGFVIGTFDEPTLGFFNKLT